MAGFIGVHIGAGYHSSKSADEYAKVCKLACKKGSKALAKGKSAVEAATIAVSFLEDSPISNAGLGSCLTIDGTVECDASVMDGSTNLWGAVGAVSDVKNPCKLAKEICMRQSIQDIGGRVPPSLLVGPGATKWAKKNKIKTVEPNCLITGFALKKHEKYKNIMKAAAAKKSVEVEQLDTVGAVCIDGLGNTASVCSSGGIALKECGRIGQAAMFGAGVWAENFCDNKIAVACCTSGTGEYLIRTNLARTLSNTLRNTTENNITYAPILNQAMKTNFLESPFLTNINDKHAGALILTCYPNDGCGEFLWAHTTKSFILAYTNVHAKVPKTVISTVDTYDKIGKSVTGGGVTFNLPAVPHLINQPNSDELTSNTQFTVNVL